MIPEPSSFASGTRNRVVLFPHGKIRSHKSASQWFSAAARAAGVTKTAHGLRKSRMIRNAEGGATSNEIAAWSGHESIKDGRALHPRREPQDPP